MDKILTSRQSSQFACHLQPVLSTHFGFITLFSRVSEFFLMTEKAEILDEKPHNNNIHPAGTDWWPTNESSSFHLSFFNLHVECSWEPDHYLPHSHGWPSQDSHVLISPKFLFLGNLIHNCLYSQISVQHINWWQGHYLHCLCCSSIFYLSFWDNRIFPSSHYVLWPLGGHLQTSGLCDHHE